MTNVATGGEYGNTRRSIFKGADELRRLSKGLYETHNKQENKLFNTKADITRLIEGLDKKGAQ
jgi:hypothetical protein